MPHRTDPWYMCPAILAAAVVMPGPLLPQQNPAGIREEVIAELSPEVRQNEWEVVAVKDGSQLAWREKRGGKYTAVLNGKPVGGMFDELVGLRFSKNGKRLVFAARTGKEWTFVVDGTPGTFYKDVGAAEISSDGRHFAFAAQKGKQWLMVVDGVEGPLYDTLGRPRYTPDTNRLFYVGRRGKVDLLVEDGKEKQLADSKNGYSLAGSRPRRKSRYSRSSMGTTTTC